jgi:hypothetical protein
MHDQPDEAGPQLAILAATYGWTPAQIEQLTLPQLLYYLRWVPLIEARKAYPLASLEASVLNLGGGKRDANDPDAPAPRPAHLTWTALERLPPWANLETGPGVWTSRSARALLDHATLIPAHALARVDMSHLRRLAGA